MVEGGGDFALLCVSYESGIGGIDRAECIDYPNRVASNSRVRNVRKDDLNFGG